MSVTNLEQHPRFRRDTFQIPQQPPTEGKVLVMPGIELPGEGEPIEIYNAATRPEQQLPELTPVEIDALYCLARGDKVLDIRRKRTLNITFSLKSIYDKYKVDNATQAVSKAIKNDVLDTDMLVEEFDFSIVKNLTDKKLRILRGLTATEEPNTNDEIAEEVSIAKSSVAGYLNGMYDEYELGTRPKAAAFYLIAERMGLINLPERKPTLAQTERIVLSYAARGFSLQETAEALGRSFHTVDTHMDRIFRKYDANNQTKAVVLAIENRDIRTYELAKHFDFSKVNQLTERQRRILKELINTEQANSNIAIAERTGLSPMTIVRDLRDIKTHHDLQSRAHIAAYYLVAERGGLLVEEEPIVEEKKSRLTEAEQVALTHAAKGLSSKQSGKVLDISAKSVDGRIEGAAKKYEVSTKTQAVVAAIREGDILLADIADSFDISYASRLTQKQIAVLKELTNVEESSSDEAVAERLEMTKFNVKSYMRQILASFNLRSRTQAAVFYLEAENQGLLP